MTASPVHIRPVGPDDEHRWCELFTAYRAFYRLPPDQGVVRRVWSWVADPAHEVSALVAEVGGAVVGIADYRRFARPSTGTTGLWLDDLFTDPAARGHGAGRALIGALQAMAAADGLSVVRWITAEDNAAAQRLYDTLATRTTWVTYDATPSAPD